MSTGLWTLLATVVAGALLRLPPALVMFSGGAAVQMATFRPRARACAQTSAAPAISCSSRAASTPRR